MRGLVMSAVAGLAVLGPMIGAMSPAHATSGTVTVPNGVFYECFDQAYTYDLTLRPGYVNEYTDVTVSGPDGLEVSTDLIVEDAPSGSSELQLCRGIEGTYTVTAEVTSCTPTLSDCYKFATAPSTFTMRYPYTRTGLSAKPKRADRGDAVKFVMTVQDERPAGYFDTDDIYVRLQQYRDSAWRNVPGAKKFVENGRDIVKFVMKTNSGRFRAYTATESSLRGSVSRTVRVR